MFLDFSERGARFQESEKPVSNVRILRRLGLFRFDARRKSITHVLRKILSRAHNSTRRTYRVLRAE